MTPIANHFPVPFVIIYDDRCAFCRFLSELGRRTSPANQVQFFPMSKAKVVFYGLDLPAGKLIAVKRIPSGSEIYAQENAWKEIVNNFSQLSSLHWLAMKIVGHNSAPMFLSKVRSLCLQCGRKFA